MQWSFVEMQIFCWHWYMYMNKVTDWDTRCVYSWCMKLVFYFTKQDFKLHCIHGCDYETKCKKCTVFSRFVFLCMYVFFVFKWPARWRIERRERRDATFRWIHSIILHESSERCQKHCSQSHQWYSILQSESVERFNFPWTFLFINVSLCWSVRR